LCFAFEAFRILVKKSEIGSVIDIDYLSST
jgi:hypothetical protein